LLIIAVEPVISYSLLFISGLNESMPSQTIMVTSIMMSRSLLKVVGAPIAEGKIMEKPGGKPRWVYL
jgi:hypothetical protein